MEERPIASIVSEIEDRIGRAANRLSQVSEFLAPNPNADGKPDCASPDLRTRLECVAQMAERAEMYVQEIERKLGSVGNPAESKTLGGGPFRGLVAEVGGPISNRHR